MLNYFTPATLKKMYQDLDKARLDILVDINEENLFDKTDEYRILTDQTLEISTQYESLTGLFLWAEF